MNEYEAEVKEKAKNMMKMLKFNIMAIISNTHSFLSSLFCFVINFRNKLKSPKNYEFT